MSIENIFRKYPIKQIGYFVPDIKEAALRHSAMFGSGPFLVSEHIPLNLCMYRGKPAELDHSSCLGQWGEIQIEFCQQHNPGPSYFTDLYPNGKQGFHHVALWVDDLIASMKEFEALGYEISTYAEIGDMGFAMVDCIKDLGHLIEIYEPDSVRAIYDSVKKVAQDFDGTNVLRQRIR